MIKKIIVISIFCAFCLSCTKAPEVVESDYSFTPSAPQGIDKTKIQTPPVDLLNNYVYFKDPKQSATITLTAASGGTIESASSAPSSVTITLKMSKALDNEVVFDIVPMTAESHPKTYAKIVRGLVKVLPAEAYTLSASSLTFASKNQEQTLTITFVNDQLKGFDVDYKYVLPLVAKAKGEGEYKYHNYFLLTCTVTKS